VKPKRTILVVDDVAMFRDLGSVFLARAGRVVTACTGEEALEVVQRERPHLVLADLHMPEMDGEALCRAIKSDPELRATPVVVMVGTDDPKDRGRAARAGADDILSKPLSRVQLLESVQRFLIYDHVQGLPRVELAEPVCISVGSFEAWGTVRNLSRGGLFIESDDTLAPCTEVDLRFELPESEATVEPTAQVIWRRESAAEPRGMGLRFLEVDGGTARRLADYVFEHLVGPRRTSAGGPQ
jgi:uncharacterized protein (TIGR02266 family)